MSSPITQQFLTDTLHELQSASINTWIFGGWAEELWDLRPAGQHRDIDLLYPAENFTALDRFLQSRPDIEEVLGKHFSHKRAFQRHGILIEIFLLAPSPPSHTTNFFGLHLFHWPQDTLLHTASLLGLPTQTASPAALRAYREQHQLVEEAWRNHLAHQV